jgi:SMODS and SLOG-associating 2TM effector domain 2
MAAKKADLKPAPRLSLDWVPENATNALQQVHDHVLTLTEETINWYIGAKNAKRVFARSFRALSIILGAVGALLPTIGEILSDQHKSSIPAGWTAVLLGIVGILLLLDRFFGFSTGWMRYISTELHLRQIAQEFQLDWEAERSTWQGAPPSKEQIGQMMAKCKALVTQVNNIVREETSMWVQEFENAIRQIDEASKAKQAITEPGALNLTVTNGDAAATGWTLSIDNGSPETYQGKTAGKRNLIPGRHEVKVQGDVGGKTLQAEKVITVPAGGACEEILTLS